jgi:signal transduction histidine kinase
VYYLLEEIPQAIAQTLEGISRVATIVGAMKVFGHPSTDKMAAADINEAVRNTLIIADSQIKHVADVELELGELPAVICNLGDINQAILNLVVNASHAMGERYVSTNERGVLTIRTCAQGDEVLLEVQDTGGGIPRDIAERVFEPFFTTKGVGVGTGQGLALTYSLIHDRHSGSITFVSEPGVGTTFTIRLPVSPPH